MPTTTSFAQDTLSGISHFGKFATQSAKERVEQSAVHQLSIHINENKQAIETAQKQAFYQFGDTKDARQTFMVQSAIDNFEQSYQDLVTIDRRIAIFSAACLASCILSPILPGFISGLLFIAGGGGSLLTLGGRESYFRNYYNALENLKDSLSWMANRVSDKNVAAAINDANILKATELLLPIMKEEELGEQNAPGTLDALISDNIQDEVLKRVRLSLDKKNPKPAEEDKSWVHKYFAKEQKTMHFMVYGDGRGSMMDFFKGIWFFIKNIFTSLVNFIKGEKQPEPEDKRPKM